MPEFHWIAFSDVHMGAAHVPATELKYRLESVIFPEINKGGIDLVTVGGDFYDNALLLDNEASTCGIAFFHDLFTLAKRHNTAIRIIRGTYTHDRDQLKSVVHLAKQIGLDFAYYTDVATDTVKGKRFLYLPDNLSKSAFEYMEEFQEQDLQVDFIVGHGYCEHTLPVMVSVGKHVDCWNADTLIKHMRHCAVFGHVHQSSIYKQKVFYTGSFDRLCHGDEDPKGALFISLDKDNCSVTTLPNDMATPHITVHLTKETIEDCLKEVRDTISVRFPQTPYGYLRISGDEKRTAVRSIIQQEYTTLVVTDTDINKKKRVTDKTELEVCFKTYTGDVITKENIAGLVHRYLQDNVNDYPLTEEDICKGIAELQQGV